MTMIKAALLAALLAACGQPTEGQSGGGSSPATGSLFASTPAQQWRLPPELREISGLATTADGRLFGHDDERAVIYEIDARSGRIVKRFSVGEPQRGDFEGLAIDDDGAFWLTTSSGQLMRFREGADGARVNFESFNTDLGPSCEVEGLAFLAATESLILACKRNEARDMRETVVLYQWRPGAPAQIWRSLPEAEIARAAGVRGFRPSAVEIDPRSGRTLILSASDGALAELGADGAFLSARALRADHRQAEGLAVLANGALVVADEGRGARAALSVYNRAP